LVEFFPEFDAMPKLRHGREAAFVRQSLGKAQAKRWLFPTSSEFTAGAGKKAFLAQASAGQLDNNWLILFRLWMRLLQSGSR